ncbi:MAG: LOG family protein [Bacilli bacterium]|nr:LOG family protein [Bacilli bacterium]
MKLFISGYINNFPEKFNDFELADNISEANMVLILPGGVGTMHDLFKSVNDGKRVIVYNKDFFYTPIIKKLFELYEEGIELRRPSEYMEIESEMDEIIKKLEDNKYE